ncbi:hypothetical protein [Oscillatoria nigro-viridis]
MAIGKPIVQAALDYRHLAKGGIQIVSISSKLTNAVRYTSAIPSLAE